MADPASLARANLPADARTIQWAPNAPAVSGGRPGQGSIGACDACRSRKVRCLAGENTLSNKCQRCARAGRECVYTVHSKTRRRKRTDTRVKELEEKLHEMSMLLQGKQGAVSTPSHKSKAPSEDVDDAMDEESDESSEDDEEDDGEEEAMSEATPASAATSEKLKPPLPRRSTGNRPSKSSANKRNGVSVAGDQESSREYMGVSPDVVERGIISMKDATELFDRYVNVLVPNYPAVIFPPGATAAEIRKERPILFLGCIAAAASAADPEINLRLNQEILQVYATKVALEGQKSLDLVQSILISSLWYYPPERFDQLKFHQYIHMAATMALDLGIGKRVRQRRSNAPRRSAIPDFEPQKLSSVADADLSVPTEPAPDSSTIESRRTILACYLQCASVSLSLRLPNALRFTSYMAECLDVLETSPQAAPTDERFTAWIRIQRIVEECVNAFALDDPEGTVSLSDIRIQNLLKGYEKQMEEFRRNLKPKTMNAFLEVNYHVNNIFIHEIALHPDHDPEDFRPPFFVSTLSASRIPSDRNPAYVNAVMECVASAQKVLKIFITTPVETIRALPSLIFVRTVYSCVVLIKLEISTRAPTSELRRVLDHDTLALPTLLQKIMARLVTVVGTGGKNIIAAKFLIIFKRLFEWYRKYRTSFTTPTQEPPQPLVRPPQPQSQPVSRSASSQQQQSKQPSRPQPLAPPLSTDFNTPIPTQPPTSQPLLPPQQSAFHHPQQHHNPYTNFPTPGGGPQLQGPLSAFPHLQQQTQQLQPFSPPTSPPSATSPNAPQHFDFHASLLATTNHSSPRSLSSPETSYLHNLSPSPDPAHGADQQQQQHGNFSPVNAGGVGVGVGVGAGGGTGGSVFDKQLMVVDPAFFGQLQDMERPFSYQAADSILGDWVFDAESLGITATEGAGMAGGGLGGGGLGGGMEYEWGGGGGGEGRYEMGMGMGMQGVRGGQ